MGFKMKKVVLVFCVFLVSIIVFQELNQKKHGEVKIERVVFSQSAREINNPDRGVYCIYGFVIQDQVQDYRPLVAEKMCYDSNRLAQIQINLRNYSHGEITPEGILGINKLFETLKNYPKHYIVRFLYNWEGTAQECEPTELELVLRHMEQLAPVFERYQDIIFVHQGIMVGECAEMYGSPHLTEENMPILFNTMRQSMGNKIFLSVRTPAQWRKLVMYQGELEEIMQSGNIASRVGLFNDGMLGSAYDCGTYGEGLAKDVGYYGRWKREEELLFQEQLCKRVPNGGEVIIDNPYNDFKEAVSNLRTMHVTYLNQDYDAEVWKKWEEACVTEPGCFQGMDGATYIKRNLGYRLLIDDTTLEYNPKEDKLYIEILMQNVGFAPLYEDKNVYIVLYDTGRGVQTKLPVDADLRKLSGGNEWQKPYPVTYTLDLSNFSMGNYEIYICTEDGPDGQKLILANEQECTKYGYLLGKMEILEKTSFFERILNGKYGN